MPWQTKGFEGLLEAVPDALVGVDRSGVIRFVNHQTESLFGYEPGDLVGAPLETLVPQSLQKVNEAHSRGDEATLKAEPLRTDPLLSGRARDGTEFPVDVSFSSINTGGSRLVIAAVHDMTPYQRAEAAQRRLDRLAALIEFSRAAVISSTVEGIITGWNPAAEKLYGYSSQEIVGRSIVVLGPEGRAQESRQVLARFKAGQTVETLETLRVRKDRTEFPALLTISPIRDADGLVVGASTITRDMTQERQAFEAAQLLASTAHRPDGALTLNPVTSGSRTLEGIVGRTGGTQPVESRAAEVTEVTALREALEAAQSIAAIVEHTDDSITGHTPEGIITSWNLACQRLYGYSGTEILGRPIDLLSPKDRAGETGKVLARITAGEHVETFETVRLRKDGTLFPASLTVSPIRDAGGTLVGASTIARDMTNQKEASDLARSMIESSLDPLVTISPEGRITDANQATVKATGVPRDMLIGTPFSDYFTAPERANRIYQRVFSEGTAVDYPLTLRHRDGTQTAVLYNASVYRDIKGNVLGVFAAARDVTKQIEARRKIAEQQARELDRIAELERFQRLMVGRELKMIEMKKEIEYLRRSHPAEGGESHDEH